MKRILFSLLSILLLGATTVSAQKVARDNESLNYRVMYKWGLVNKQAGHATLTTSRIDATHFRAVLTASSEKWADKFYTVRDTLLGTISLNTCEPTHYEKIAHENGTHKHDVIDYTRSGKNVTAECRRSVQKKDEAEPTVTELQLEAEGLTLDILSSFYYMRSLPFHTLKPDDEVTLTCFSGKRKETLTIRYIGLEPVNIDGKNYTAYKIKFSFTGEGGKKTSDDMTAWISAAPSREPLKLEGSLPVGKVQCYLIP